jgi:hypothetical protein
LFDHLRTLNSGIGIVALKSARKFANKIHVRTWAVLVVMGSLLSGCGESDPEPDRVPIVSAAGLVRVQGKPAVGAHVRLHPLDATLASKGLFPDGVADDTGQFHLTTYAAGDGAPAGEYRVTVTWPDESFKPEFGAQREALLEGAEKPDRLKGKYANPGTSGLSLTIVAGNSEPLKPIDLQ